MNINLNDRVAVQLKEKGKEILWKQYQAYSPPAPARNEAHCKELCDIAYPGWQAGRIEIQLWEIMELFGSHHLSIGINDICETDIEILEPKNSTAVKKLSNQFPATLYVQESLGGEQDAPFDGYTEYATAEDDDTVAVYQLKRVCRVREKTEKILEDIP